MAQNRGDNRTQERLRVLAQGFTNPFSEQKCRFRLEDVARCLDAMSVDLEIDPQGDRDPRCYSLVHIFHAHDHSSTNVLAGRAHQAGVPFVVSLLGRFSVEVPVACAKVSQCLMRYVDQGQQDGSCDVEMHIEHEQSLAGSLKWIENAAAILCAYPEDCSVINGLHPRAACMFDAAIQFRVIPSPVSAFEIDGQRVRDFVLCAGPIARCSNQLMLLKALEDWIGDIVLISDGTADENDYREYVRAFRRKGKTHLLSGVQGDVLNPACAACRVYVSPGWRDVSWPCVCETAGFGKNVVVNSNDALRKYLGAMAFYCDPSNEQEVRNAVLAAFYAPPRNGLPEAAREYQVMTYAKRLSAIYQINTEKYKLVPESCSQGRIDLFRKQAPESSVEAGSQPEAALPKQANKFDIWLDQLEWMKREGKYSKVKRGCDKILTQEGRSAEQRDRALLIRAETLMLEGDIEDAEVLLDQVLMLSPGNSRALCRKGTLAMLGGQLGQARLFFDRALEHKADFDEALAGLAAIFARGGDKVEAWNLYSQAFQANPLNSNALLGLADLGPSLQRDLEVDRAIDAYLKKHSTDLNFMGSLIEVYLAQSKVAKAKAELQRLMALAPDYEKGRELQRILSVKEQSNG